MTISQCPICSQYLTIQPGITDFVHICRSGNETLDEEDIIKLDDKHWNLLGLANKASLSAQIKGIKAYEYTDRKNKLALYKQRQREVYIDLPENKMLGGN